MTLTWAVEEGFSAADARVIAVANWACDARYLDLWGKRYHWGFLGAPVVSWVRFRQAIRSGDLASLGESLHALQDTIGHGVHGHFRHWHGIDRWEHRGPRVRARLERWSRRLLAAYLSRRPAG